jgi:biotin carboxyl carrier protein
MRRYRLRLDGRAFDVDILDDPCADQVRVRVDGELFVVEVSEAVEGAGGTPEPSRAPAADVHLGRPSGSGIVAPLPGTVKSIAIESGQQVAAGESLLIIEAMKMDNVIRAPRPGVVGAVHVAAGDQVAHGDPLLDLDG